MSFAEGLTPNARFKSISLSFRFRGDLDEQWVMHPVCVYIYICPGGIDTQPSLTWLPETTSTIVVSTSFITHTQTRMQAASAEFKSSKAFKQRNSKTLATIEKLYRDKPQEYQNT